MNLWAENLEWEQEYRWAVIRRFSQICRSRALGERWFYRARAIAYHSGLFLTDVCCVLQTRLLNGRCQIDPWDGTELKLPHLLANHQSRRDGLRVKPRRKTRV